MGIGMVMIGVMVVVMSVGVMMVVVIMTVQRRKGQTMLAAEIFVPARGIAIAVAGAVFQATADTFDVMVMALLRLSDIGLEAQHLFAVLAHLAVHHRLAVAGLLDAVDEGVEHQCMIVEIVRLDELDFRMIGSHIVFFANIPIQIVKLPRLILAWPDGFPMLQANSHLRPQLPVKILVLFLRSSSRSFAQ